MFTRGKTHRLMLVTLTLMLLAAACSDVDDATVGDVEDPAVETVETDDGVSDATTECLTAVGNATVTCGDDLIVVESNGLPNHQMMVGIENGGWNGQWPTSQDYTGDNAFFVPTEVTLLDEPLLTVKNTAGVTANGIPFFFPHAPGSGDCIVAVEDAGGECLRDPVADGEMDDCGGHTGRGDDYHYHATPTCLIEELAEGAVVGYMLDGVPMFLEPIEGSVPYDGCTSGYVSPEGLLHYAFQDTFPYLTDCMLGEFVEGPRTTGSEVFTGDLDTRSAGSIIAFVEDEDGCHTMTFSNGAELAHCH